jgi:threonine dehydratase
VTIIDRPGSLNQLTTILAELGTNVVQVFHQRVSMHSAFGEAEVEWDLETKGKDHTAEIISTLTQKGYRVKRAF